MHDPMTVAFDIKRPWPEITKRDSWQRRSWGRFYWPTWVTVWHNDPERDGTDDSCGWFPRARHGNKETLKRIVSAFSSEWGEKPDSRLSWFDIDGSPQMATPSIVLDMFTRAAQQVYQGRLFDPHGWKGSSRFCQRHLFEILRFAGNGTDSFHTTIEQTFGRDMRGTPEERRQERIEQCAAIVYGWILRAERPWYQHPRWHIWHWSIQVHPLQAFKRWAFSRCAGCGRGFSYGYSPMSHSWSGGGPRWFRSEIGVYHSECSRAAYVKPAKEPA